MRFRRRDAAHKGPPAGALIEDVPFTTNLDHESQLGPPKFGHSAEQLAKAERVLGIPHRRTSLAPPAPYEPKQRVGRTAVSDQDALGGKEWSPSEAQDQQPMDTARSANGGLKPWPTLQSKSSHAPVHDMLPTNAGRAPRARTTSNNSSQPHVPHKPSNSTLRSHYDVSQPPSESLHDMGFRKGSFSAPTSRNGVDTDGRPLKSALKYQLQQPDVMEKPASKKEGSRFRGFGHFLPRQNSSNRTMLQPSQQSHYGSTLSVDSPSASRSPSYSHSETVRSPPPESLNSESTARPKVFESDVFDSAKVHVHRPPKGIQNWFDGVDVSSDEEQGTGEALPSTFSPYEDKRHQIPPRNPPTQSGRTQDIPTKTKAPPHKNPRVSQQPSRPIQTRQRNVSDVFVEENAQAIGVARQRMQAMQVERQQQGAQRKRQNSNESFTPSSWSHGPSLISGGLSARSDYGSTKHGTDSRLAHSQRANESVLNLSDPSDDERRPGQIRDSVGGASQYAADVAQASPVSVSRPSTAPRPYTSRRSKTRESTMTTQTSGSIPIHWSNDEVEPMPALPRRKTEDSTIDHTSEALRKLIGRDPSVKYRRPRPASSKYESESSVAGETIGSLPSDISRMMAVTEEEMALLEMMRQKRAAMQKDNSPESTQHSMSRQEEEHLAARQRTAQNAAKKLLRAKEERHNSRQDDWMQDTRSGSSRIAGLSSLQEDDVDGNLGIERFLASDTPLDDVFPYPEPLHGRGEGDAPRESPPTEGLLLPRTYTPQPGSQKSQSKTPSPVPPSTSPGPRPRTANTEDLDGDEDAQLAADMRQFLGGDGPSENSAFPMPPKASKRVSRRVPRTNGLLAPSLPSTTEEDTIPPIPSRSPNRMPSFAEESVLPQRPPIQARPVRQRADSDALHNLPPIAPHYKRPGIIPEPPTPSDRSERLSAFLGPNFEVGFDTLDLQFPTSESTNTSQISNTRYDSPSISTSQASPLTPTFPTPLASINEKQRSIEIASNDNASFHAYDGADQSSLHSHRNLKPGNKSQASSDRRQSKAVDMLSPATYNSSTTPSRMSSVGSCRSASDDVLAAWAELGGVSEGLTTRSRSPMHAR